VAAFPLSDSEGKETSIGARTAEIRRAATTAGIALLFVAVLAALANFAVVERLVVDGDAAKTAANIADSETLFRFGIAGLILVAALDVVVAWGLFRVLEPVSRLGKCQVRARSAGREVERAAAAHREAGR